MCSDCPKHCHSFQLPLEHFRVISTFISNSMSASQGDAAGEKEKLQFPQQFEMKWPSM